MSTTNNPTAGIYVDEMFLTSTAVMSSELFDLERIEILKGLDVASLGFGNRTYNAPRTYGFTISRKWD